MKNKEKELPRQKCIVERLMFEDKENSFRIYALRPIGEFPDFIQLDKKWGTFIIKGTLPYREAGTEIEIHIEEKEVDKNNRVSYKARIFAPPLNTIEEQDAFLQKLLTQKQFKALKEKLPDTKLVDYIKQNKLKPKQIKGFGAKTIENIQKKIKENQDYAHLINLLKNYNFSLNRLESILSHFKGDGDTAYATIKDNIYVLAEIRGWGFKTIDNHVIKNSIAHSHSKRILSAIKYEIAQELDKGNTWIAKHELITRVGELTGATHLEILEQLKDESISIVGKKVGFSSVFQKEVSIFKELQRIQKHAKTMDITKLNEYIESVEIQQGFSFTEEQRQAIINAHTNGVSIITGSAGTGKSATIKGIAYTTENYNYATMALSGRAVDVIAERGVSSSTIHRAAGLFHPDGTGSMFNIHTKQEIDPLEVADIVIVDEFSMVDAFIYEQLLSCIQNGTRLVLVGDVGQLPAVGYGDVARDLINSKEIPTTHLTTIHRQALESGIIELAYKVRQGEQIAPYIISENNGKLIEKYGVKQDANVIIFEDKAEITETLINFLRYYKENSPDAKDLLNLQIIAPMRTRGDLSTDVLNAIAQDLFNPVTSETQVLERKHNELRTGDKVMLSGNIYEAELISREDYRSLYKQTSVYNGTMGIIKQIINNTVVIDFPREEGYVAFSEDSEIEQVQLAYASTVHKLQGSSAKHVVFVFDYSSYLMLSQQLLYVAITRAEKSMTMIAESGALFQGIKTDASSERRTLLADIFEFYKLKKEE